MESLFSLQLPFQRRLTRMYTDTKSSYDFVKEPVQRTEDPEMVSLHRKLKIQKDRLVSWGLEWSDPSQSPDIDESINRAGLAELVGSIMSTIKDILAEAEPLWQSSNSIGLGKSPASEKAIMDRKAPLVVWDKTRFQDLVRDLAMSIDTLYDLSKTRQSARKVPTLKSSESSILAKTRAEERLFESTRMQAPQQIDPKTLIWPRDLKTIPSGVLPPAKFSRQIVFMSVPTSMADNIKYGGHSSLLMPVLMEHSPYDSIYSVTGITPSMSRFEKLFAALSQAQISTGRMMSGLLHLIGYFEESEHSRFCLLFSLPTHFGPVDIESPRLPSIAVLSDLLYSHNFEPSLEVKYRLANNIASAVFELHSKGVVHGNIASSNVLFLEPQSQTRLDLGQVNMRQSYLASFDLFSDNATDSPSASSVTKTLYRHSLDPRVTRYTHLTAESKSLDLYSLAMLLLEIGLWTPLQDMFPTSSQVPDNPAGILKELGARCGSLYVKAIQACWNAIEDELSQKVRPDVLHQKIFFKVSKALETCCAIDDSSDEEMDEDDDEIPVVAPTPVPTSQPSTPQRRTYRDTKPALVTSVSANQLSRFRPAVSEKSSYSSPPSTFPEKMGWSNKAVSAQPPAVQKLEKPKPALRTYPSIKIPQEQLDFWQTGLIPHINHVLRNFYKKYPESVEISLESIGESSTTTKPTILVICTSVNKVRSILKKSLIYDKSVFGLKVCRGKVVRSRKNGPRRAMANEPLEIKAANKHHQERPLNGASIGAYVGEKNLPPVSFGGLITIDDKTFGMTVHHMLDDPSDSESEDSESQVPILRSSAHPSEMPDLTRSQSSIYSSGEEEYMYPLSDYESDFSSGDESRPGDMEDDDSEDETFDFEDEDAKEPGDIKGVSLDCATEYLITQPAIDDIDEDFYPSEETRDEDHVDSFQLGKVYASSGIRRRTEHEVVHEIDWALFEFSEDRRPEYNHILHGDRYCQQTPTTYPVAIAPVSSLGGTNVHCVGRTSGLQSGRILPGMVVVKIFGRQTPSSSYQVAGKLGVPGDSGAWVVDNEMGRACGHVLAWSTKKKVAYICPMDVLVRDIADTLGARSLKLPGGGELLPRTSTTSTKVLPPSVQEPAVKQVVKNDPSNVEDELAAMLRELNLPPTPEQIDNLAPSMSLSASGPESFYRSSFASASTSNSTNKLFTPPARPIPRSADDQKTISPQPHFSFQQAQMDWESTITNTNNLSSSLNAFRNEETQVVEKDSIGEGSYLSLGSNNTGGNKIEQVGMAKRTPPPPPPTRGEIRALWMGA